MPLLETLAITIGPAIAKNILKVWLGDNGSVDVLGSLIDHLSGHMKETEEKRELARQINRIGERIAQELKPLFDVEFSSINIEERIPVVFEVSATLEKVKIASETLLVNNLDEGELYKFLLKARPRAISRLSESQGEMYKRIIEEVSHAVLNYASQFSDFDRLLAHRILTDHGLIISKLEKIISEPEEAAKRYEQDYRAAVREKLDRFELFGIPSRDDLVRRQRLREAYVVLNAKRTFSTDRERLRRRGVPDEYRIPLFIPGDQLLCISRRIVLRGDAGSGKSTLLKWLAIQAAGQQTPGMKYVVPFYVRLREFVCKSFPNDEDLPKIWYTSGYKPDRWVGDLMDKGFGLILLDGMDELPARERPIILNKLKDLVLAYPLAHYVVSSRPPAIKTDHWPEWQEWINENHFLDVSLQEMDETQVDTFINNWFRALKTTLYNFEDSESLESSPDNLLRLLAHRPQLRLLASNPLLCAMICALFHDRQQSLPSERIKLYEECIQMLLTRREEARGIRLEGEYAHLNDTQKIGLIQGFAYWLMKNGYSDADVEEVDTHFEQALPYFNVTGTTGEKVRRFFVERANLLREPAIRRIDFMHRALQEYLAARAATQADEIGLLNKNALDDQWREVIILAIGLGITKQRERLLNNLIKKADGTKTDERRRALRLLTLACLETQAELSPEIRECIFDKASEFFPPRDSDEAKLVAKAGDPAVRLLTIHPHQPPEEATSCQYTLIRIGGDSALPALEHYARRHDLADFEILLDGISFFDQNRYGEKVLSHLRSGRIPDSESSLNLFTDNLRFFVNLDSLFLYPNIRTRLTEYERLISSLTLLPKLTNLRMNIRRPVDLLSLSNIKGLTALDIIFDDERDLSILAELTNLKELTIKRRLLSDLSPLAMSDNLTKLDVSYSNIKDLTPLKELSRLRTLRVNGAYLDKLKGLEYFEPGVVQGIVNVSRFIRRQVITQAEHGERRIISTNMENEIEETVDPGQMTSKLIMDISKLDPAIAAVISELYLSEFPLVDLNPFAKLKNLSLLDIDDTRISDLSSLENFTRLTQLATSNTRVSDLGPLSHLSNLEQLDVSKCLVTDLSPLANLKSLRQLNISYTPVVDLSSLSNLENLEILYLDRTNITDLTPLSNLPKLQHIFVRRANVDLKPILHIPNVKISSYKIERFSFRR
jgi:Leucine-rich repeat (LRR) protein